MTEPEEDKYWPFNGWFYAGVLVGSIIGTFTTHIILALTTG